METINEKWYHVFAFPSLKHICDVKADAINPDCYDPRIRGDGEVVWQEATNQ